MYVEVFSSVKFMYLHLLSRIIIVNRMSSSGYGMGVGLLFRYMFVKILHVFKIIITTFVEINKVFSKINFFIMYISLERCIACVYFNN